MPTDLHQPAEPARQCEGRLTARARAHCCLPPHHTPHRASPKPHQHPLNPARRQTDPAIQHQRQPMLQPPRPQHRQQPTQNQPQSGAHVIGRGKSGGCIHRPSHATAGGRTQAKPTPHSPVIASAARQSIAMLNPAADCHVACGFLAMTVTKTNQRNGEPIQQ